MKFWPRKPPQDPPAPPPRLVEPVVREINLEELKARKAAEPTIEVEEQRDLSDTFVGRLRADFSKFWKGDK